MIPPGRRRAYFRTAIGIFALSLILGASVTFYDSQAPSVSFQLEEVASGLTAPTYVTHAGDGTNRLFVTERLGKVKVIQPDGEVSLFLDINGRVLGLPDVDAHFEEGLLSVAFHPAYEINGLFYVYYTDVNGNNVVARYTASPASADFAAAATESIVMTIEHSPEPSHNGGQLQFGPDGYLYIGSGDAGGVDDPSENAEDIESLLGKILRIDVAGTRYRIPKDNPFVRAAGLDEIWAYGLRNPWRFSFDRETDEMFIADVGQDRREEVNLQPPNKGGLNYGWDIWEGSLCNEGDCSPTGRVFPILEYPHGSDCAITGGFRYRGRESPNLLGTYLYGDSCSGNIWGATFSRGWTSELLLYTAEQISSFGEDEEGEIYVVDLLSGQVFQLEAPVRYRGRRGASAPRSRRLPHGSPSS